MQFQHASISPHLSGYPIKGFGMPEKGLNIELNVQAGSPFEIRVMDISYEPPPTSLQPRPPDMIAQPFGLSDTTVVVKPVAFK